MKLEIKIDKIVDGESYPDPELEGKLRAIFGNIENHVRGLVNSTLEELRLDEHEPIDYLGLRIIATDRPDFGFAYKSQLHEFPSIAVGYANDKSEFNKTFVHELLHFVRWDEYILDEKADKVIAKHQREEVL